MACDAYRCAEDFILPFGTKQPGPLRGLVGSRFTNFI